MFHSIFNMRGRRGVGGYCYTLYEDNCTEKHENNTPYRLFVVSSSLLHINVALMKVMLLARNGLVETFLRRKHHKRKTPNSKDNSSYLIIIFLKNKYYV